MEIRDGIDDRWLEGLYRADPAAHALAVWDRAVWPHMVRFTTLSVGGRPAAYLLRWNGLPDCPVLHFGGDPTGLEGWSSALPARPYLAIVPPELAEEVLRGPGRPVGFPLRLRRRALLPTPRVDPRTRRLTDEDRPVLRGLAESDRSTVTDTYLSLEPDQDWVVGGFERGRLVAVARAEVRLREVWHISGVHTRPSDRARGWGRRVVERLIEDAGAAGASTALFVREDNEPARRLYDRLGFDAGSRRIWLDAGADRSP